jgi:hypothetical protein
MFTMNVAIARMKPPTANHSFRDMLPARKVAPDVVYAAAVVTLSAIVFISTSRTGGSLLGIDEIVN